jgi:tetratricopeptide (TPR) repeat protein
MGRRSVAVVLLVGVLAGNASRAFAQATPAAAPAADLDAKKKRAQEKFEQGVKLFGAGAIDAALAEFLASRGLFPTRAATTNAASCLNKLSRFDEALDMYETYLREFPSAPAEERDKITRDRDSTLRLVGTLEIRGAEPGATVVVDGRERGKVPAAAVRVASGTHVIRVFKEGFVPFETRVEVAGGQSVAVTAALKALAESGRVKVGEQSGKTLDVLIDGIVVGKTPWEGPLEIGEHTLYLRGEGTMGTQPVSISVKKNEIAPVSLVAESLDASLRVAPTPGGARIAIDGVVVARGVWEGRLRVGAHRVEVAAEGFLAQQKSLNLPTGARESLALALERDPDSALWKNVAPPKITFELDADGLASTTLGGQLVTGCTGGCSRGFALGGAVRAHGTYQTRSGIALGGYLGYAGFGQGANGRATALTPVGQAAAVGTTDDSIFAHAAQFGLSASYRKGESLAWMARLSVGMLLGGAFTTREGTFSNGATSFAAGPLDEASPLGYLAVLPELRAAYRLGEHFEISAGLLAYALVATTQPKWRDAKLTRTPSLGFATYGEQTSMGSFLLLVAPSLGARYDF